jgi:DNA-binding NtrC family response regulator
MTTEQVCIILNEREPSKERLAQTLFDRLASRGITAKRLFADPKLDKIIKQRQAQIFVLDYIIGDYTTGLDILTSLNSWEEPPTTIFLTDEPSLEVAVEAMKLGARDYISTDSADSLDKTIEAIRLSIRHLPPSKKKEVPRPKIKFSSLTSNAASSAKTLQEAKAIAATNIPLLIILGEPGSGRTTWAEAIMNGTEIEGYYSRVDWRLYSDTPQKLFGTELPQHNPHKFGTSKSLIIEGIESDTGSLLNSYGDLTRSESAASGRLIVTTDCSKTAQVWQSTFAGRVLQIPSLKHRHEDILEISQIFLKDIAESLEIKPLVLTKQHTTFLAQQDWPGNIRQLRECLFEFALLSQSAEGDDLLNNSYTNSLPKLNEESCIPGALEAQITLDKFCGDFRLAAMHLGTSVPVLYKLLNSKEEGSL